MVFPAQPVVNLARNGAKCPHSVCFDLFKKVYPEHTSILNLFSWMDQHLGQYSDKLFVISGQKEAGIVPLNYSRSKSPPNYRRIIIFHAIAMFHRF